MIITIMGVSVTIFLAAAVAAVGGEGPAAPNHPGRLLTPTATAARALGGGTIDATKSPPWWLSRPDEVEAFLRSLHGIEMFELGRSAGGRPILAAAWGPREDLPGRTSASLASAIAGGDPHAFYGKGQRQRQCLLFLGAAHGTEIEGTVAALNLLNVLVAGKDLRGKTWPRMAAAGRQLRVVIVPFLNIDGRQRFRQFRHFIGMHPDDYRLITNGSWRDGTLLGWPQSKLHHPLPLPPLVVADQPFLPGDLGKGLAYSAPIGWPAP